MEKNENFKKSGYLDDEYRLFHLKDSGLGEFDFHYHDFCKILIFLGGNVTYIVEGQQYDLRPYDILLVDAGQIHKPVMHPDAPYERIILYLSPRFFTENSSSEDNLFSCFLRMQERKSSLLRPQGRTIQTLTPIITQLAEASHSQDFGTDLYRRIKILEFLLLLNRTILREELSYQPSADIHPVALQILSYINDHVTQDLTIDGIAADLFLARSTIMHLFKAETGYTIGKYITEKRLFLANQAIESGASVTDACYNSGFRNYSAFYHAYKQKYQSAPRKRDKRS